MAGDLAPLGADELDDIERRGDGRDVARLVHEVRRLARLAEARADEILRLSRALDDETSGRRARTPKRTA